VIAPESELLRSLTYSTSQLEKHVPSRSREIRKCRGRRSHDGLQMTSAYGEKGKVRCRIAAAFARSGVPSGVIERGRHTPSREGLADTSRLKHWRAK
jgi:hypothetical protein